MEIFWKKKVQIHSTRIDYKKFLQIYTVENMKVSLCIFDQKIFDYHRLEFDHTLYFKSINDIVFDVIF